MQRLLSLLVIWSIIFGSTPALSLTVNGQLKGAILEKSTSDLSNWEGRVYWNTTDKQAKVYNGTDWTTLGSGSGGDGLDNQIENPRAEEPVVPTSFKVYDDGAVAEPVDCTGGTPTAIQAWTRSTSSPIQGDASWLLQKDDAEDAQGQGWAIEFTVPADHPMASSYYAAFNFDFKFSDSDGPGVRIYVYDVTNSAKITPDFISGGGGDTPTLTPVTASTSRAQLGFQTTNGTSYRICVHNADTDTDGYSLKVDGLLATTEGGVQVGASDGPWEDYTPTYTNATAASITTDLARCKRSTEDLICEYRITIGGNGTDSGTFLYSLPTGRTADISRLSSVGRTKIGEATQFDSSATDYRNVAAFTDASPGGEFYLADVTSSPLSSDIRGVDLDTGDVFFWSVRVPVAEFAGGTALGENQIEYACSTTGTWDANASSSDTIYGQAGCPITGSLSADRTKDVVWQTPMGPGDVAELYLKLNGGWTRASQLYPYSKEISTFYGAQAYATSASGFQVFFARYVQGGGATFGSAGANWSSGIGSWVLVKHKVGVPVRFGMATSERPGLVSYEDSGSFSCSISGPFASAQDVTIAYTRVGSIVSLRFPQVLAAAASAVNAISVGCVPASLRPTSDSGFQTVVWAMTNGADYTAGPPGVIHVSSIGSLTMYKSVDKSAWGSTSTNGWNSFSVTYGIQ